MTIHSNIQDLLDFIKHSPTAWHAVENASHILRKANFKELKETDSWQLESGQRYFVVRNGSSLCAFITPEKAPLSVRLLASHTDSPGLKLKPQPEIRKQHMILFGVEIYGAPLLSSWLNRDLGLAGRITYLDKKNLIRESLVRLEQAPLTIPQLAIHLDREVNEKGLILNKQEHLNALAALDLDNQLPTDQSYLERLLKEVIEFKQLLGFDLFLYPLESPRLMGYQQQMIAAYRLDNLASFHAALQALMSDLTPLPQDIKMIASWDNEEIGSNTAQGAASPFVNSILERILLAFNLGREAFLRLLNHSLCVSIDLAHALHPNYIEKHDGQHQLLMGNGTVLKTNAQFRYASDARSSICIQALTKELGLPLQKFVSRNDIPAGTTIGPVHASASGMSTVDIGLPELSMHSCREIMACRDHLYLCQLLQSILTVSHLPSPNF